MKRSKELPSAVLHTLYSKRPHWPRYTFRQFRNIFSEYRPYQRPFATRFCSKGGRPIDPKKQQRSFKIAHDNRERLAVEMYAKYCELADSCKIPGCDFRENIENFMEHLHGTEFCDKDGISRFKQCPNEHVVKCTTSAVIIAEKFGGQQVGLLLEREKYKGRIGYSSGGHDFALVGDYLVDWWAVYVDESHPVGIFLM